MDIIQIIDWYVKTKHRTNKQPYEYMLTKKWARAILAWMGNAAPEDYTAALDILDEMLHTTSGYAYAIVLRDARISCVVY